MGAFWVLSLATMLFVVHDKVVLATEVNVDVNQGLNIWPLPDSVSHGHKGIHMSKDFHFELESKGNKYNDGSGIFKDAFSRFLDVIRVPHVVDGNLSKFDHSRILQGLNVVISSSNDEVCIFLFFI